MCYSVSESRPSTMFTFPFYYYAALSDLPSFPSRRSSDLTYSSGSGGATLTFAYTTAGGENSADLSYTAHNSLALSTGTLKDAATNNTTLTLRTVRGANSIGGQKAIVVDTANPTAPVTTPG